MTQRLDYNAIAPAGMKAMGAVYAYVGQSGLPTTLIDLCFLRASQINGCAYCIDMHSRDLIKHGLSVEKLVLVQAWEEAGDLFDPKERAALSLAETVTRISAAGVPDADYGSAANEFSEKELVDLVLAISLMNAYNRMAITFRAIPAAVANKS